MAAEYKFDTKKALLPAAIGAAFVIAAFVGVSAGGLPAILYAILGLLGALALIGTVPTLFDRRAQFVISLEGLLYRPFSADVVPWSDVTAVAYIRTFRRTRSLGTSGWLHQPSLDSINFDVADATRYRRGALLYRPSARLVRSPGRPVYPITPYNFVGADSESVLAAIKSHWRGEVQQLETPEPARRS